MEPNTIRAIIFLIAGLLVILFSGKLLEIQGKVTKKLGIKYKDSRKAIVIIGICLLIISIILFIV
tara:strand:- start:546 stop:740 length:195 start_codon:yes stop_codon:yes gene_type:complete